MNTLVKKHCLVRKQEGQRTNGEQNKGEEEEMINILGALVTSQTLNQRLQC